MSILRSVAILICVAGAGHGSEPQSDALRALTDRAGTHAADQTQATETDRPCSGARVEVCVTRSSSADGTTYRYHISNPTDRELVVVLIGTDWENGEGHLDRPPKGWSRKKSEHVAIGWSIDRSVASVPNGWMPMLILFEESHRHAISWMIEDLFEKGLRESELTVDVTLESEDASYESAPWTVIFADGRLLTGKLKNKY
jgi:hypothetical protein